MTASTEPVTAAPAEAPLKQNGAPSKRHEEYQYLDLVREILEDGEHRPDRYATFSIYIYIPMNHVDPNMRKRRERGEGGKKETERKKRKKQKDHHRF